MTTTAEGRRVWGIVGGMGPVASAEFVKTIYGMASGAEQGMPALVLHSDPSYPDRTEALMRGDHRPLARQLEASLSMLRTAGATDLVIACMTIHAVLAHVDECWRRAVWSLVNETLQAVRSSGARCLMLCSNGSRHMRVFENSPLWAGAIGRIVRPHEVDQAQVHRLIGEIKANTFTTDHLTFLESLRHAYGADCLVAGCTEFHVVNRRHRDRSLPWIDPLEIAAARIVRLGSAVPAAAS